MGLGIEVAGDGDCDVARGRGICWNRLRILDEVGKVLGCWAKGNLVEVSDRFLDAGFAEGL